MVRQSQRARSRRRHHGSEKGRVYVSATTRRKVADLDIREHTMWIPDDVSLTSVEEKEAFLKRELAPGKLRLPRGGLKDHNKDGSIDWKDLTVHSERIYQLRDTDNDGTADKMTVFAEGFNSVVTGIAAGILYHDGWVYVTVAPDLVRLRDTNDDGVADEREIVAHGFGMHIAYAGHDMHGPRIGPDGRIYWSIGDKGVNVTSKEAKSGSTRTKAASCAASRMAAASRSSRTACAMCRRSPSTTSATCSAWTTTPTSPARKSASCTSPSAAIPAGAAAISIRKPRAAGCATASGKPCP
jgi:hypothetical protein